MAAFALSALLTVVLISNSSALADGAPSDVTLPQLSLQAGEADSPTLEIYGTFHAMGVIVTIPAGGDPDGDASVAVEYRRVGQPYRPGFHLSRVADSRFVGSLFWLEPGTVYDVQVSITDPDSGPLDDVVLSATAATREEITVPPPVRSLYVHPEGNGAECSMAAPCALTQALGQVQPGYEVVLRGGVYYEGELTIPNSGAPGAPIVVRSYEGESAILDGSDPATFTWEHQGGGVYRATVNAPDTYLVVANGQRLFPYSSLADLQNLVWDLPGSFADGVDLYVRLEGDADPNVTTMAVSRYGFGINLNKDFIFFLDLTFRHYGRDPYAKAIFLDNASDILVQDSVFTFNNQGINIKHDSYRNVIQDNEFYDSIFDWHWNAVKQGAQFMEPGGVYVNEPSTGRGNVIRRNTFHDLFDGFHVCPGLTSGLTNETDVYENLVYRVGDDGMETDGQCSNVRIWDNEFHDVLMGISMSPVYTGPVYAIRNLIYDTGAGNNEHFGSPFKFIHGVSSDGAVYLFHNTFYAALTGDDGLMVGGEEGKWNLIVSRNNVWSGNKYALRNVNPDQYLDFDYDDLYTTSPWRSLAWWGGLEDPDLPTLADLRAETGQEMNGLNVEPGFVDTSSGDYRLAPHSSLIDAGVVIPGVNDQGPHTYRGRAPDIGAFEWSSPDGPPPPIPAVSAGALAGLAAAFVALVRWMWTRRHVTDTR